MNFIHILMWMWCIMETVSVGWLSVCCCAPALVNSMMAPASVEHLLTYIHDTGMSVVRHLHSTNILVNIWDIRRRKGEHLDTTPLYHGQEVTNSFAWPNRSKIMKNYALKLRKSAASGNSSLPLTSWGSLHVLNWYGCYGEESGWDWNHCQLQSYYCGTKVDIKLFLNKQKRNLVPGEGLAKGPFNYNVKLSWPIYT